MVLLVLLMTLLATAAGRGQSRPTGRVGGEQIVQRAHATRSMLFGAVPLYSVGIYTAHPVRGVLDLRRADLTKGVRIAVLYKGGMPQDIPSSWWEELVPVLTPEQQKTFRAAFRRLAGGDDIWITYAPALGTAMICFGRTIMHTKDDALMNAVLDLWLDETPVSQDVHDRLMADLQQ
jgi:hypothetical protein